MTGRGDSTGGDRTGGDSTEGDARPVDPRRVEVADVLVDGRPAATLTRVPGAVDFAYRPEYLAAGGPPVATTLPLTEEPVTTRAGALPPYFSGLLPEGRRLTALRAAVKTSADDDLSLLLAVGDDPVGNVQVRPGGPVQGPPRDPTPVVGLDDDAPSVAGGDELDWGAIDFVDLLGRAAIDPAALAGVQDKVSGRMLTVPLTRGGRLDLLKLQPPEYPGVVDNEAFFLRLAGRLRHPVVAARVVHDRHGRPGLLVRRFDRRVAASGRLERVAVEDAAQLLGRYPADKYAVSTEQVLDRVGQVCAATLVARRAVLAQVAFAWLTGNGDLHAKNVSVLREGGEWRVAPIYDIPSTLPYGDRRMALSVAGRDDSLSRRRYLELAAGAGVPERAAVRALEEVLAATADLPGDLAGAWDLPPHTLRDLRRVLGARRRALES